MLRGVLIAYEERRSQSDYHHIAEKGTDMSRLLRRALEDEKLENEDDKTIAMVGPLSEVYTQALHDAYAKQDPTDTALESQAIDALVARDVAKAILPNENETDPDVTIYGVNANEITESDVIEVTQAASKASGSAGELYVVIDGMSSNSTDARINSPCERTVWLGSALESITLAYGGKVFKSLPECIKSL